ncbi:MAG: ATP-binding cassette domain-containing protein [Erysipelotrichaceae bacterium]
MSVLTLENVSYQYKDGKKNVLNNLSMAFEEKTMYAIMGKSGAGKTTLLSLLSGLDHVQEGVITYVGEDVKTINQDAYRSQHIGVIFQSYNLLLNATALENIVLSMHISGSKVKDKHAAALALLARVGIDETTARRKILKLSGGEQQRVGIARALSHDPKVIIADEPTGNLDEDSEENVMTILQRLAHEEDKCVIVVTHGKRVAAYADTVLYLEAGHFKQK